MTPQTSRAIRLVVAVAVTIASPLVAAAQQSKVEQELMQIERDWCTALIKKDATALGRILADDSTSINRTGHLGTKAEELAGVKSSTVTSCELDMMKARVYGDAAVITGRSTIKARENYQVMWTDTFIRKDGRWQCVATQSSEIRK